MIIHDDTSVANPRPSRKLQGSIQHTIYYFGVACLACALHLRAFGKVYACSASSSRTVRSRASAFNSANV